ncbi:MAG TPA: hypothetical protein VFY68_01975, partial [Nitrososphaeraceae archaeon]|nr:hypothetical protein [Nitrososphaeraceae archaeon]
MRLQGINSKNKHRIVLGIIVSAASIVVLSYYLYALQTTFKPKEIYPTKQGGREWYLNIDNPLEDEIFDPGTKIAKLHDGSWLVGEGSNGNHQVRMNVITPPGQDEWKNVEITGYVKVIDTASGDDAPAAA